MGIVYAAKRFDFVDLNRDQLSRTALGVSYTGMRSLWLPRTVLEADFLVSMPKIKTHHWSGVTLSMKDMFSVGPGGTLLSTCLKQRPE